MSDSYSVPSNWLVHKVSHESDDIFSLGQYLLKF